MTEYIPKTVPAQAMVAKHSPRLQHVEYVLLVCQHLGKTLMKNLRDGSTDVGVLQGLNSLNCPCCIESKMKHTPNPGQSLSDQSHIVSFDMFGPIKQTSLQGNRYGLIFVVHRNHFVFGYPMKTKDQFPEMLRTFLMDFRQISNRFPEAMDLRILRSNNAKDINSAQVEAIFHHFGIKHQFSASNQQHQDAAEKAVGDVTCRTEWFYLHLKIAFFHLSV